MQLIMSADEPAVQFVITKHSTIWHCNYMSVTVITTTIIITKKLHNPFGSAPYSGRSSSINNQAVEHN